MLGLAKKRTMNIIRQRLEEQKTASLVPYERKVREAKSTTEMVTNLQTKLDVQDNLDT